MNVTFLGTNGWYDTPAGNTCSVLIQSREYNIIFDAGNGIASADRYLDQNRPTYLFISHYHLDHIAGLHTIMKFRFRYPLCICGQPGIEEVLRSFVRDPFTVPFDRLPFPVRFLELREGLHQIPFGVECRPLVHPVPVYGYAVMLDGKKVTFCTDTGTCPNAVILARNADLLITECGLKPGEESPGWPHLNPGQAIGIANAAGAGRLALVHFGPLQYPGKAERHKVQESYASQCPGLLAATDGQTIEV